MAAPWGQARGPARRTAASVTPRPLAAPLHCPCHTTRHPHRPNCAAFLRQQLALQQPTVARYMLSEEQVWLKKAGARHGMGRYRVLGALARWTQLEVLRPVPNLVARRPSPPKPGACTTWQRGACGFPCCWPARIDDGLLLRHLGHPGEPAPSLGDEMQAAIAQGPAAVQELWRQGLEALQQVHSTGTSLSQAFARNLVRCPDGVVGFIDFEDDPTSALPWRTARCATRCASCIPPPSICARAARWSRLGLLWAAWVAQQPTSVQTTLNHGVAHLAWLRHLPQNRRLGRDLQRARAAYALLTPVIPA